MAQDPFGADYELPAEEPLDLVDVALLLSYERTSTEPRFRHTKLREVAYPGKDLKTVQVKKSAPVKNDALRFIFDRQKDASNAVDLPSNILPAEENMTDNLRGLSPRELETIFYQAREHDGCYTAVTVLQYFFDLFPRDYPIRIRHAPKGKKPGESYTTTIEQRGIIEMIIDGVDLTTVSIIRPENTAFIQGNEPRMDHAVMAFGRLSDEHHSTVLDLSSMQFGELGRGPGGKGQGLFALDTFEEYSQRIETVANGIDMTESRNSARIGPHPQDEWLKRVARRAKVRWDIRERQKWCGHCGAPVPEERRCARCRASWFCCKEHQEMAWPFHKGYCTKA